MAKKIFWIQPLGAKGEAILSVAPSPPHPAGCAGLCVPDRCLTALPEVAGQTPVLHTKHT